MSSAALNVWDRYPGESPEDYKLFLVYLEQDCARTFANVVRRVPGYSYSYVTQLGNAWLWSERAEAYDAARLEERKREFQRLEAEKAERWAHNQLELAELATQILRDELIAIKQGQAEGRRLPPSALTQLMGQLHKWQQMSTGQATDSIAATIDLDKLSESEQAVLQDESVRSVLEQIAKR